MRPSLRNRALIQSSRQDLVLRCVDRAMEWVFAARPRKALWWARLAYWIDPQSLDALNAKGQAFTDLDAHHQAIRCFQRIYRRETETGPGPCMGWVAGETAYHVATCYGHLSRLANSTIRREDHAERALAWLAVALRFNPAVADDAETECAFIHLHTPIHHARKRAQTPDPLGWLEP